MIVKAIEVASGKDLIVERDTLREAGLQGRLRLVVQKGEIRILDSEAFDPEKTLEELAGCLGQESAEDYDFNLKFGGLYEAR
jgi:hypothetical protein